MSTTVEPTVSDVDDHAAILSGTTCTVEQAAFILGLSAWSLYRAVRTDKAPVPMIRCGRRILVPVAPLRRLLGLDEDSVP